MRGQIHGNIIDVTVTLTLLLSLSMVIKHVFITSMAYHNLPKCRLQRNSKYIHEETLYLLNGWTDNSKQLDVSILSCQCYNFSLCVCFVPVHVYLVLRTGLLTHKLSSVSDNTSFSYINRWPGLSSSVSTPCTKTYWVGRSLGTFQSIVDYLQQ